MWIVLKLSITLQLMVSLGNAQPTNITRVTQPPPKNDGKFSQNNILYPRFGTSKHGSGKTKLYAEHILKYAEFDTACVYFIIF